MRVRAGRLASALVSTMVHVAILAILGLWRFNLTADRPQAAIETIFLDESRLQNVNRDLEIETVIAETLNFLPGGTVTAAIGGSASPAVAQERIQASQTLQEPEFQFNPTPLAIPGAAEIGSDLGAAAVTGEVGRIVDGYGAALGQLSRELLRLMRAGRIHVVWLFDESESMKDDQREIQQKFHKLYEELRLVTSRDGASRPQDVILLTSIYGFGEKLHALTKKPTSDARQIRAAIDQIPIDESGIENFCQAVATVVDEFGPMAQRTGRRLVVIVVSDESGDDGELLEGAMARAHRYDAPVYILGREAVFGYPYARIRWIDPVFGLSHWLPVRRGPETAFVEALQYDGLHARDDVFSSGFGPYVQVRIAKETGGIFFRLPNEEENLTGKGALAQRKFDALDMKEYEPLLLSRREYLESRAQSPFRNAIWTVIETLNPRKDPQLSVREHGFPIDPAGFQKAARKQFDKALRAMSLLSQSIAVLDKIEPLRSQEASMRWRANYDLALAQCLAYRVRLFQYLLAMDRHSREMPQPKNPKSNRWNIVRTSKMLEPSPEQIRITKIDMAEIQQQVDRSHDLFRLIVENHPGTPWAQRAAWELRQGLGMTVREGYHDPRYREFAKQAGKEIRIPKL